MTTDDILNATILIVDDQAANVLLLERMLRSAGYSRVSSTQNPKEVAELHRLHGYALILLDLQMPCMDGFEVMESLKAIGSDDYLPVLVVTAQPDKKLRALKAGARDFVSKPFDLAEVLARVHNLLEVRLLHLETQKLYAQLAAEQLVHQRLLHNILPHAIVERLSVQPAERGGHLEQVIVDSFPAVTVLFADIVGFTQFSAGVSAELLVDVLNEIFTRFDTLADERGMEKIKTIGDAYMAAAGLPMVVADHADRAAHMALDMLAVMAQFSQQNHYQLQLRIGISTGAAVAGVIGKRKFLYDLWGDTVNTASRMESHGVAGRIQISEATRLALGDSFVTEARGAIPIKGKGEMRTWFLNARAIPALN